MLFEMPDLDEDTLNELTDSIQEALDEVEIELEKLASPPYDEQLLQDLFRHLHTIKGNFRVCLMIPFNDYVHGIEETISEIREGRLTFNVALKDVILAAIDNLRACIEELWHEGQIDIDAMNKISHGFLVIATAEPTAVDKYANALQRMITGEQEDPDIPASVELPKRHQIQSTIMSIRGLDDDLKFFQTLAFLLDTRTSFWIGRTQRLLGIVSSVLPHLSYQLDQQQLHAAIYVHDVGMAFFVDGILELNESLDREQDALIAGHPYIGHQLLRHSGRWEEASQMVLQHHERTDGSGYPKGLKGEDICPGARLIAVADAFCTLTTQKQPQTQPQRRIVLRALMELNNRAGSDFDIATVEAFTLMASQRYKNEPPEQ